MIELWMLWSNAGPRPIDCSSRYLHRPHSHHSLYRHKSENYSQCSSIRVRVQQKMYVLKNLMYVSKCNVHMACMLELWLLMQMIHNSTPWKRSARTLLFTKSCTVYTECYEVQIINAKLWLDPIQTFPGSWTLNHPVSPLISERSRNRSGSKIVWAWAEWCARVAEYGGAEHEEWDVVDWERSDEQVL